MGVGGGGERRCAALIAEQARRRKSGRWDGEFWVGKGARGDRGEL